MITLDGTAIAAVSNNHSSNKNMQISTTAKTLGNGTFTLLITTPNKISEDWTVQAHFRDARIRPVDDLSPIYNKSDSIIRTFDTIASNISDSKNPLIALVDDSDTNINGSNDNVNTPDVIDPGNIISNKDDAEYINNINNLNGTLIDLNDTITVDDINMNDTTLQCPEGTTLDDKWGICQPTANSMTADSNDTEDYPVDIISNGTTSQCPEEGMVLDDLSECIFPDFILPTPDIITDGGEDNDTIVNPESPTEPCPPDTNLDESTGICFPPDISSSVPDSGTTDSLTTSECPPNTLPDDTGMCFPLDINEQPASNESAVTEEGELILPGQQGQIRNKFHKNRSRD